MLLQKLLFLRLSVFGKEVFPGVVPKLFLSFSSAGLLSVFFAGVVGMLLVRWVVGMLLVGLFLLGVLRRMLLVGVFFAGCGEMIGPSAICRMHWWSTSTNPHFSNALNLFACNNGTYLLLVSNQILVRNCSARLRRLLWFMWQNVSLHAQDIRPS